MVFSLNPTALVFVPGANAQNISMLNPQAEAFQPAAAKPKSPLDPKATTFVPSAQSSTLKLAPGSVASVSENITKPLSVRTSTGPDGLLLPKTLLFADSLRDTHFDFKAPQPHNLSHVIAQRLNPHPVAFVQGGRTHSTVRHTNSPDGEPVLLLERSKIPTEQLDPENISSKPPQLACELMMPTAAICKTTKLKPIAEGFASNDKKLAGALFPNTKIPFKNPTTKVNKLVIRTKLRTLLVFKPSNTPYQLRLSVRAFVPSIPLEGTSIRWLTYDAANQSCRVLIKRLAPEAKCFMSNNEGYFVHEETPSLVATKLALQQSFAIVKRLNPRAAAFKTCLPAQSKGTFQFNPRAKEFNPMQTQCLALVPWVNPSTSVSALAPKTERAAFSSSCSNLIMSLPTVQELASLLSTYQLHLCSMTDLSWSPLLCMLFSVWVEQVLTSTTGSLSVPQLLENDHNTNNRDENFPTGSDSASDKTSYTSMSWVFNKHSQFDDEIFDHEAVGGFDNTQLQQSDLSIQSSALLTLNPSITRRTGCTDSGANSTMQTSEFDCESKQDSSTNLEEHVNNIKWHMDRPLFQPTNITSQPRHFISSSELRIFGPSRTQILVDGQTARHYQDQLDIDDQVVLAPKPYHHLNFLGHRVHKKSDTDPATSLAVINTSPKADMSATNGFANLHNFIVLHQAFLYIDPVIFYGEHSSIDGLSASQIRREVTGRARKLYSAHGTWLLDSYNSDEDKPQEDLGSEETLEGAWTTYNGITEKQNQPNRLAWESQIELDAEEKEGIRKSKHTLRKQTFAHQPKPNIHFAPPYSSPLRKVNTPESIISQDRSNTDVLDKNLSSLLKPSTRSWVDLDEDSDDEWNNEEIASLPKGSQCFKSSEISVMPFTSVEVESVVQNPVPIESMCIQPQNLCVSESVQSHFHCSRPEPTEHSSQKFHPQSEDESEQSGNQSRTFEKNYTACAQGQDATIFEPVDPEYDQDLLYEKLFPSVSFREACPVSLNNSVSPDHLLEIPSKKFSWEDMSEQDLGQMLLTSDPGWKHGPIASHKVRPSSFVVFNEDDTIQDPRQSSIKAKAKKSQSRSASKKKVRFLEGTNSNYFVNINNPPELRQPTTFAGSQDNFSPKNRGLVRSPFTHSLANVLKELEEDKENLRRGVRGSSGSPKASTKDEDKSIELPAQCLDGSEHVNGIDVTYNHYGLPKLGQKPSKKHDTKAGLAGLSGTSSTIGRYRKAGTGVQVVPCIVTSPTAVCYNNEEVSKPPLMLPRKAQDEESGIKEEIVHPKTNELSQLSKSSTPLIFPQTERTESVTSSCFAGSSIITSCSLSVPDLWPNFDGVYHPPSVRSKSSQASIDYRTAFRAPSDVAVYRSFTPPDNTISPQSTVQPSQHYALPNSSSQYLRGIKKQKVENSSHETSISKRLASWIWSSKKKRTPNDNSKVQSTNNDPVSQQAVEAASMKNRWFNSMKNKIARSIRGRK